MEGTEKDCVCCFLYRNKWGFLNNKIVPVQESWRPLPPPSARRMGPPVPTWNRVRNLLSSIQRTGQYLHLYMIICYCLHNRCNIYIYILLYLYIIYRALFWTYTNFTTQTKTDIKTHKISRVTAQHETLDDYQTGQHGQGSIFKTIYINTTVV